jgi:hypothetical protein
MDAAVTMLSFSLHYAGGYDLEMVLLLIFAVTQLTIFLQYLIVTYKVSVSIPSLFPYVLSPMSQPTFSFTATAEEVATAFASEIRGKNGTYAAEMLLWF